MTEIKVLKHYSFSSLSLAESCTNSWLAKYVLGLDKGAGLAAQFGLGAEARLAQRMAHNMGKTLMDLDKTLEEEPTDLEVYDDKVDGYFKKDWAWDTCDGYQIETMLTPAMFDEFKQKYGVPGIITPTLPIKGFIDFKKGNALMDLKTSKIGVNQVKWWYQTIPYLLCEGTGMEKVEVHLWNTLKTMKYKKFQRWITDDDIREVLQWISAKCQLVELLRSGALQGSNTDSFKCGWCAADTCHSRDTFKQIEDMG